MPVQTQQKRTQNMMIAAGCFAFVGGVYFYAISQMRDVSAILYGCHTHASSQNEADIEEEILKLEQKEEKKPHPHPQP